MKKRSRFPMLVEVSFLGLVTISTFFFAYSTQKNLQKAQVTKAANDIYYVSISGNDSNLGSQSAPWRTIQKAASTAGFGKTVIVLSGTYNETVNVSRSGIIFQASGVVTMKGFNITTNGDNTKVIGFRVDDTPQSGIELYGDNSVIKNNIITRSRNAGMFVAGNNNLIENNDISLVIQPKPHSEGGDANCFSFFGGGHVFRGNKCHDISRETGLVTDAHLDAFQTWNWGSVGGNGHDILFEKNVLLYPNGGTSKGWIMEGGSNITIKNNIVYSKLGASLVNVTNISFINNTFVGTGSGSDGLHFNNATVSLYNNIFAHQNQRVIENIGGSSTITAGNNCYIDYGAILSANTGDIRAANALFVNESQRDYRLQSGSPCVNRGRALSTVADDINGVSRPQGSAYDMGAYEYGGASSSPTPRPIATVTSTPTVTSFVTPTVTLIVTPTVPPFADKTTPPGFYKSEYFDNDRLSGTPLVVRSEKAINFDWGTRGSPDSSIKYYYFSARWTKTEDFEGGMYRFSIRHNQGSRIYVDDKLIYNKWDKVVKDTITLDHYITPGSHTLRIEYREEWGDAYAHVSYRKLH